MAIIYGFKVNLSVAIVAMVNQTAIKENSGHPRSSATEQYGKSNISNIDILQCSVPNSESAHDHSQEVINIAYPRARNNKFAR